jgi:hypothetical protein
MAHRFSSPGFAQSVDEGRASGAALAMLHNGVLFTAFVGLNLVQSTFTGWCPMMTILRRAGVH